MSNWTTIHGIVNLFVRSENNNFTNKQAEEFLINHFGPYKTYYNNVDEDLVSLPMGSEGSITYRITDITDYQERETKQKHSKTPKTYNNFNISIIFNGDLRDYWNNEELSNWIKSISNIYSDDELTRAIIETGFLSI